MDERFARRTTRRLLVLGGLQVGVIGTIGRRMYQLGVREADTFRLLAEENRVSPRLTAPEWGRLLDRHGTLLADGTPTWRVMLTPDLAGEFSAALARLGALLALPPDRVTEVLEKAAREPGFQPIEVRNRLSWDEVARVTANAPPLPGVTVEMTLMRAYPMGADLAPTSRRSSPGVPRR